MLDGHNVSVTEGRENDQTEWAESCRHIIKAGDEKDGGKNDHHYDMNCNDAQLDLGLIDK
jgi:hypothetical protein